MSSPIPLWITVMLGIVAILGPVGGAAIGGWITARRDDRRWEREHEKETEAHRREIERDDSRYWRDRRIGSYSVLLNAWRDLNERVTSVVVYLQADPIKSDKIEAGEVSRLAKAFIRRATITGIEGSRELALQAAKAQTVAADLVVSCSQIYVKQLNSETRQLESRTEQTTTWTNELVDMTEKVERGELDPDILRAFQKTRSGTSSDPAGPRAYTEADLDELKAFHQTSLARYSDFVCTVREELRVPK